MTGPYFDFLVVDDGEYWERVGRLQRIRGLKPEYHRRPDALRVPHELMEHLFPAFMEANPAYASFGITEFKGETIDALANALLSRRRIEEVGPHLGALGEAIQAIVERTRTASESGKVLLVLGI